MERCNCGKIADFSIKGKDMCSRCVNVESKKVLLAKLERMQEHEKCLNS